MRFGAPRILSWFVLFLPLSAVPVGCSVGAGEGRVFSPSLEIDGCSSGAFELNPNFFAASSYGGAITLRVQRGDLLEEASDGLLVVIPEAAAIRGDDGSAGLLSSPLKIGLPVGVSPPGIPIVKDPDPPKASLVLYLNDSCDDQNVSVYSVGGTITFESLWSGNTKEENSEERLTVATFEGEFADSRALSAGNQGPVKTSRLEGSFRFFFQRSQPAQAFP